MLDEQIRDGDLIIVQRRPKTENGEAVLALVNGEATVKRIYRENDGMVRLQPTNDNGKPIGVRADQVEVRGVVVAVIRKYYNS
jgi:repressor LexA